VIVDKAVDELLGAIGDEAVSVLCDKCEQSGLLYFLEFFGNVNDQVCQSLHFLLSVLEIFHVLHGERVTKKLKVSFSCRTVAMALTNYSTFSFFRFLREMEGLRMIFTHRVN
jgi:hypothetical protein